MEAALNLHAKQCSDWNKSASSAIRKFAIANKPTPVNNGCLRYKKTWRIWRWRGKAAKKKEINTTATSPIRYGINSFFEMI